jgi:DNA polymerase-3 subunit alpha
MKANYPVDYMAALLTADAGEVEKIAEVVAECKRMGIEVLPPSVNESRGTFTVIDDTHIRFGMYSIKNFGTGVADSIIAARESGEPFKDIGDFLARAADKNLNKKSLESLIQSGAMDELGERGELLANIEILLAYHREHVSAPTNQGSLFGALPAATKLRLPPADPASLDQKLVWEKELLGLYVSGHPLDKHKHKLQNAKNSIRHAKENLRGVETVIAGFLETAETKLTKNGERMLFARISDFSDGIELIAFPRVLKEFEKIFAAGACIAIKGKISERNGEASFVVEKAKAL